jgi:ATP phosphoribosyltransferase regulatory subunit
MGLRADSTPQVARIDAHILNRQGVTRLCYCGPVLHTRPGVPHATREPLQLGAEIYGHAGREADLEVLLLALDCLKRARVHSPSVDMADARIVRALLGNVILSGEQLANIHAALAAKDSSELSALAKNFPVAVREDLLTLVQLYGDSAVLEEAEKVLQPLPVVREALSSLKWFASRLSGTQVTFDLSDLRGYAYYTGARFAIYAQGAGDALVRGGRYDEVGAVFGRNRPAAGFSLDIKALVSVLPARPLHAAIRAPWRDAADLSGAIASLRARGETVVCAMPGHESEVDEFHCDRELIQVAQQWVVQAISQ